MTQPITLQARDAGQIPRAAADPPGSEVSVGVQATLGLLAFLVGIDLWAGADQEPATHFVREDFAELPRCDGRPFDDSFRTVPTNVLSFDHSAMRPYMIASNLRSSTLPGFRLGWSASVRAWRRSGSRSRWRSWASATCSGSATGSRSTCTFATAPRSP